MNNVALVGRLARDPVSRTGAAEVAVLRLAVPRRSAARDDAVFVNVVVFDRQAAAALEHLRRGRRVAVVGRLDHRRWTDDSGARRERHEVVADHVEWLDAPAADRSGDGDPAAPAAAAAGGAA
ncbi:MAG TPA: single-stranded DNA-binding protein [Acidimicrobiales bacterium]|nr:single-stranded DNA-binding protein [Acidimicrobiales bacterium]